ncbi:MAG: hypothetical protein HQK49_00510 [Oligoflexia bacterium]|nr:hypothetical protein [Oligoflexia bacterium]
MRNKIKKMARLVELTKLQHKKGVAHVQNMFFNKDIYAALDFLKDNVNNFIKKKELKELQQSLSTLLASSIKEAQKELTKVIEDKVSKVQKIIEKKLNTKIKSIKISKKASRSSLKKKNSKTRTRRITRTSKHTNE